MGHDLIIVSRELCQTLLCVFVFLCWLAFKSVICFVADDQGSDKRRCRLRRAHMHLSILYIIGIY